MSGNWAFDNKEALKAAGHYVRSPEVGNYKRYQFVPSKISGMADGDCLVLVGQQSEPDDFYAVPCGVMRVLLTPDRLKTKKADKGEYWEVSITEGMARVEGDTPSPGVDVTQYRGVRPPLV